MTATPPPAPRDSPAPQDSAAPQNSAARQDDDPAAHDDGPAPVLVAVVPEQPPAVVRTAASFAHRLGTDLLCAWVDTSRYVLAQMPDGALATLPLDPDLVEAPADGIDPGLETAIAATLDPLPVRWSARSLAGGAAQELAALAEEVDAAMIVVGTREAGWRGSLHELLGGSVAVQLAHRQHRPVMVVPLDPDSDAAALPDHPEESA